jgi:lambda family phage tail tape measure protein
LNARTRAQAQAAAGDGEFSATTNKVSDSLERQFLALTASRSQLVAYDADLAGATAVEKEYLVSLAQGIELRQREIALGAEYAAAIKAEAAAAEAGTFANTAFVREIGVIFREISEGRITQAVASFTRLLSVANLLGLVFNPVTIGVAALGYAAIKGAEEVTALNNALITTGNYAGTSAAQLEASANAIGATGERTGVAIEALTKLAATGKFSASQITEIGTAATAASDTTGVALDKIVAEFVKLQGDPVKASAELNSQYHYLTLSVYDQIDALAKQGDAVGAAQAATDAYANALKDRAADSVASLGTIESAWDKVKNATSAAIEAAKGIGKPTTPQDQLAAVNAQIAQDQGATSQYSFRSQRGAGPVQTVDTTSPGISTVPRGATAPTGQQILSGLYQQQSALSTEIGSERNARDLQGSYEQTQATGVQAQQTLDRLHQEYIGRKDVTDALTQQAAALKAVAAAGGTVQPGEGSDLTAAIQKRGQTRTPGAAGLASAEREQPLQDLKDQYDLQNSLNKDQETILDDNHRARLVKDDDFFKQEQILNDQDLANKLSYNTRLVALLTADMNASSTSAKQRVEDQTAIDKAQSASNVAIAGWAAQSTAINDKSVDEANAKTAATQKYIDALNAQILKEQEAADAQLAAAGLGKTQGKQAGFEAQAQTKEQAGVATATSQYLGGQIDTAGFTARVTAQQQAEAQSVAIHQNTTAQLAAADTSWSAGATKAWDNWENQADNTTGQVATATTGFLNGLSDQLLKFAETGKANFQALAESFVSALAKMEVQAAESKVFGLIEQGLTGGTGLTGGGGAIGSLLQALGIGGTSTASLGLAGAGIDSAVTSSTADIASQAGLGLGTQFGALAAGFATGGHITGPGSGTSDSIPARLSNGEFVVNAAATSRNLPLLHSLNGSSGSTPGKTHFADGGVVNTGAGASQGSTNVAFHINQTNSGGQQDTSSQAQAKNAALQKDLQAAVIEIVRKHSQPGGQINQIIRGVSTT